MKSLMFFSVILSSAFVSEKPFTFRLAARSRDAVVVGGYERRDFVVGQKFEDAVHDRPSFDRIGRAGRFVDESQHPPACPDAFGQFVHPHHLGRERRESAGGLSVADGAVHFVHKGYFRPFGRNVKSELQHVLGQARRCAATRFCPTCWRR